MILYKERRMDKEIIVKRAKEYVQCESDPFFKNQVEDLLEKIKHENADDKFIEDLNDRFYTDLKFGTGALPVSHVLMNMGIEVIFVEEQKKPDGNFPGIKYLNPEEPSAMRKAWEFFPGKQRS